MARTRVRRFRSTLALAILLAVVLGFLAGRAAAGPGDLDDAGDPGRRGGAAARPSGVHVVRPGDTLWAIASRLAGPGRDPRPVVDVLAEINGVRGALISPGDRLELPSL